MAANTSRSSADFANLSSPVARLKMPWSPASPRRTGEASARAVSKPACSTSPQPLNAISQGKSSKTVMTAPPDQWHKWLRYDTTISRDFFRTLDTLTRLQHARRMKRAGEASVMVAAGAAEVSDSGIRFVSQDHHT